MELREEPFRCFDCVRFAFGTLCLVFTGLAITNAFHYPTKDVGGDGIERRLVDQTDRRGILIEQGAANRIEHRNDELEDGSK